VIVQQEQTGLKTAPLGPPRTSVSGLYGADRYGLSTTLVQSSSLLMNMS
jgi:hypothetical protein